MTFEHEALDPRSKLALTVAVVVAAVASGSAWRLVALLLAVAAVVVVGRGFGLRDWLGAVAPVLYVLPLLLVLNTLFYAGGASIWTVNVAGYRVGVTAGGVETAVVIALRLLVVTAVAAWFAATTVAEEFEAALVAFSVPWSFAFLLSLTVRLVPEMRRRFAVVEEAQRSRGLTLEGGPLARARARVPMFLPFFSAVIRYGYDLSDALTARGYGRIEDRTSLVVVTHEATDYVVDAFAVVVLVAGLLA
ncbi:MAG: energy-coupling factor transporter transmembrane component T [Halanaeroarchaeum sp.]